MLDTWIAFISSGEVVVPGACYLEMILAGVKAHLGPQVPKTEKKSRRVLSIEAGKTLVSQTFSDTLYTMENTPCLMGKSTIFHE